jgi:SecD/SecF fusion protein
MTSRRSNLTLLAVTLAAVFGVLALALPVSPIYQGPKLGLDLQGGLEIVLRAVPPKDHTLTPEDMDRSVEIMRARVDKLGVSEPEIRQQGDDQIGVQLPGISDPEQAAALIGKTAQLWLFDLQANVLEPTAAEQAFLRYPQPTPSLFQLLKQLQPRAEKGTPEEYYLVDPKAKRVLLGRQPEDTPDRLRLRWLGLEQNAGKKFPKRFESWGVPENTIILNCGIGERYCPGINEDPPTRNYYYLFKFEPDDKDHPVPEMTGADLKLDGTRQDFRSGEGAIVLMEFTGKGGDKFHAITRELAARGRAASQSVDDPQAALQSFAIVLDREIKSAPTIDWNDNPDGIAGGSAEITGIGDVGEAKDLALVLQTGALPVEFEQIDLTEVSATLGKDSLREAITASLIGLVVVALFLLLIYRFLGLVAIVGLALNATFLYAVILLFDVTLTLPGFAGMILAIGVAADANIVIFERIKEEAAARKSVRAAISAGYRKGFATIVDANVVTALTALILFSVATGGVRGFAFMLLLGTVISIFTAVFATRALLGMLAGFRWFDNPRFMGASAQEMARWQMFDAVGKRRIWFSVAGVLIAISIGSLFVKGLNLSIDFRGGTQVTLETGRPTNVADVRTEVEGLRIGSSVVQGTGKEVSGGFRSFQIKTEPLTNREQARLTATLEGDLRAQVQEVRNVSASFSRQILRGAIYAVLISFLLITIYITFRFQWRFAVPILRTIANDGLIALGIYSLSGREVSAATVAAFLTIIGYSIYDTIIIFDRVRENLPLMRRSTVKEIINTSLWETVRRSLATTIITLLPVGALFLFGGAVLKDFAFAILIGIGISAFSTIFIAAPFLAVLLERVPEYKGRVARVRPEDEGPEPDGGTPARRRPPRPTPTPSGAETPAALMGDGGEARGEPAASPEFGDVAPEPAASAQSKRERRRQRRRTRPHGRTR